MVNLIPILSAIIFFLTIATLIFAVAVYFLFKKRGKNE